MSGQADNTEADPSKMCQRKKLIRPYGWLVTQPLEAVHSSALEGEMLRFEMEDSQKRKRHRTEQGRLSDAALFEPHVKLNRLTVSLAIEVLECARRVNAAVAEDLMSGMSVDGWAKRYHLTKNGVPPAWVRTTAQWSVRRWRRDPQEPFLLRYNSLFPPGFVKLPQYEYDPVEETRKAAANRICGEIKKCLDEELIRIEKEASQPLEGMGNPLKPVPAKRNPEHITAFARFQVLGWGKKDVLSYLDEKDVKHDVRSVERAFKELADLLQIDLRRDKPGPKSNPRSH